MHLTRGQIKPPPTTLRPADPRLTAGDSGSVLEVAGFEVAQIVETYGEAGAESV